MLAPYIHPSLPIAGLNSCLGTTDTKATLLTKIQFWMNSGLAVSASKAQADLCQKKGAEVIGKINSVVEELFLCLPKWLQETSMKRNKFATKQLSILLYFFKNLLYANERTLGETYAYVKTSKLKNVIYLCNLLFQNSLIRLKLDTNYSSLFKWGEDFVDIYNNLFVSKFFHKESTSAQTDDEVNFHFKVVGQLQLLKLLVKACFRYYKSQFDSLSHSSGKNEAKIVYEGRECLLCSSENTTNPSVGKCGHIFCFDCFIKWTSKNLYCPLCRFKMHPREIIPLRN